MNEKEQHSLLNFQVEVDKAATRDWYAQSEGWDCDCGHCRNFLTLARVLDEPVDGPTKK